MTERYLFRGKRTDNGELVIGKIVSNNLGVNIICDDNPPECERYGYIEINEYYKVDPATIGQCTGLRDKNDKLIFETDIVKVDLDWPQGGEYSRDDVVREVIFYNGIYSITSRPFMKNLSHRPLCECYNIEIIGNIHEHPDLLKENKMSTRATIEFTDDNNTYYVYRHSDGFPEIVLADMRDAIKETRWRWSDPEVELLVTLFLAKDYDYKKNRLPNYMITSGFHGDESYRYYCRWNYEHKEWNIGCMDEEEEE